MNTFIKNYIDTHSTNILKKKKKKLQPTCMLILCTLNIHTGKRQLHDDYKRNYYSNGRSTSGI